MNRRRIEQKHHQASVELLHIYEKQGHLAFFHTPNGAHMTPKQARIMKSLGMRAGVMDLTIMWPGGVGFIEMKAPDGGQLSPEQIEFGAMLNRFDIRWAVARSSTDVDAILLEWGVLPKAAAHG